MKETEIKPFNQASLEEVWQKILSDAHEIIEKDPLLEKLMKELVFSCRSLSELVAKQISVILATGYIDKQSLFSVFFSLISNNESIIEGIYEDLAAVATRDPACRRLVEPIIFYKGFQSLQAHRLAHSLWKGGRKDLARSIQSISSQVFQTDIHPAAYLGKGIMLDHATGLVIGETAVIEDNVSLLQNVTLGGTGKESGNRHPKIRQGVLIGAGATVLGNIVVGPCSKIAAGSVVLKDVPARTTVAGVPAKVVGLAECLTPSKSMNQTFKEIFRR